MISATCERGAHHELCQMSGPFRVLLEQAGGCECFCHRSIETSSTECEQVPLDKIAPA